MLLFYLAVLLILIGLLIVFLATESVRINAKRGDRHAFISRNAPADYGVSSYNQTRSGLQPESGYSGYESRLQAEAVSTLSSEEKNDEPVLETLAEPIGELTPVSRETDEIDEAEYDEREAPFRVKSVMYEDRDSVVVFSHTAQTIDVDRFNRLKRVASGELLLSSDNISFRSDESMYRFDFSRIRKIEGEKNAILVYPDSFAYPLLFVGISDDPLAERSIRSFSEYAGH